MSRHSRRTRANKRERHQRAEKKAARRKGRLARRAEGLALLADAGLRAQEAIKVLREVERA